MSALTSKSGEWMTPPWLVEKCREALGGKITLDAAANESNNVAAQCTFTKENSAFNHPSWRAYCGKAYQPTLFLNAPGERTGKLVRRFWHEWHYQSLNFHASVWVDFNLDHLRFMHLYMNDLLVIPRKRIAFVDANTDEVKRGAQIGSFFLLRGRYDLRPFKDFQDYLLIWGN